MGGDIEAQDKNQVQVELEAQGHRLCQIPVLSLIGGHVYKLI